MHGSMGVWEYESMGAGGMKVWEWLHGGIKVWMHGSMKVWEWEYELLSVSSKERDTTSILSRALSLQYRLRPNRSMARPAVDKGLNYKWLWFKKG